jgi:hypothetical protein
MLVDIMQVVIQAVIRTSISHLPKHLLFISYQCLHNLPDDKISAGEFLKVQTYILNTRGIVSHIPGQGLEKAFLIRKIQVYFLYQSSIGNSEYKYTTFYSYCERQRYDVGGRERNI